MDRREFLRSTGGVAAAFVAGSSSAQSADDEANGQPMPQQGRDFRIALSFDPTSSGLADDAMRLARRISELSGGVLRTRIVDGIADTAVPVSTFGFAHGQASSHSGFAFFAGLPGSRFLAPQDLEGWLTAGGGQLLWDELASEELGTKPFLAGHSGPSAVMWSSRPITAPEDFAGLRVLARGLGAEVMRGLGAVPAAFDNEAAALKAIHAGDVDVAEWGSLVHAHAAGVTAKLPFGYAAALTPGGSSLALQVPLRLWEDLSDFERAAIAVAASDTYRQLVAEEAASRDLVVAAIRQTSQARVLVLPPAAQSALDRMAAAVVAHAAVFDERSSRINASFMLHLARTGWRTAPHAPPIV